MKLTLLLALVAAGLALAFAADAVPVLSEEDSDVAVPVAEEQEGADLDGAETFFFLKHLFRPRYHTYYRPRYHYRSYRPRYNTGWGHYW